MAGFHTGVAMLAGSVLLGVGAGMASAAYIFLIAFAEDRKPSQSRGWIIPILVYLGLAAAACPYPQILGNGKDVVQQTLNGGLTLPLATILLGLRSFATTGCLSARTPGGLFTPTVTVGALTGLVFGDVWRNLFRAEDPGSYAIIGATAFLAATTKGPISSLVLMIELTGRLESLLVPMILSVAVALLVCRHFDSRSIYMIRASARPQPPVPRKIGQSPTT